MTVVQLREAQAKLEADKAKLMADQAQLQKEKAELEGRLGKSMSSVMETRESARGAVMSLPGISFETGKAVLKQSAQITLAKLAGIAQVFPNINLRVEGYTDNVGSAATNQKLSEARAKAVYDFLKAQGVADNASRVPGPRTREPGRGQRDGRRPREEPPRRDRRRSRRDQARRRELSRQIDFLRAASVRAGRPFSRSGDLRLTRRRGTHEILSFRRDPGRGRRAARPCPRRPRRAGLLHGPEGMDERFRIDLGGFFQTFDTTLSLDSAGPSAGTEINLEDDLGQDTRKTSFAADGYWRFGRARPPRLRRTADVQPLGLAHPITKDIVFGDHDLPRGGADRQQLRSTSASSTTPTRSSTTGELEFGLEARALGRSSTSFEIYATGSVTGPRGHRSRETGPATAGASWPRFRRSAYFGRFTLYPAS